MGKNSVDKKTILLWILSLGVLVQSVMVIGFINKIANREKKQGEFQEELSEEVKKMIEEELDER